MSSRQPFMSSLAEACATGIYKRRLGIKRILAICLSWIIMKRTKADLANFAKSAFCWRVLEYLKGLPFPDDKEYHAE